VDGLDDVYDCEEAITISLDSLKPNQAAVVVSNDREWDVDDQQGLLRARLVGGEWEYLTPFKYSLEPDHKLLNCGELKAKLDARFRPPKRSAEGTRIFKPRGPERESIYPINKDHGLVAREFFNGELHYGVPWPPMWLGGSQLGTLLIEEFWAGIFQMAERVEVAKDTKVKRCQGVEENARRQKRSKHDDSGRDLPRGSEN
jgi:hypothetical protein